MKTLIEKIEVLETELSETRKEIDTFEIDPDNYDDQFCKMLDDWHEVVEICGITFYPSDILKECDPVAYKGALNDYCDNVDLDDIEDYQQLVAKELIIENEIAELEDDLYEYQEAFSVKFYELWEDEGLGDTDEQSSSPWGLPWIAGVEYMVSDDAENDAELWFTENVKDIKRLIEEETGA